MVGPRDKVNKANKNSSSTFQVNFKQLSGRLPEFHVFSEECHG